MNLRRSFFRVSEIKYLRIFIELEDQAFKFRDIEILVIFILSKVSIWLWKASK
jgi:hypothetical protein